MKVLAHCLGRGIMGNIECENESRRNFLRTAAVATAASFTLANPRLFAASPQAPVEASTASFKLFTAGEIEADCKALQAVSSTKDLAKGQNFALVMVAETAKLAEEFEWHEGRDHILQVLDGTTVYEVGGSPRNGRNIRPGEWLAPKSEGATRLTLSKGDMLIIPRGTPHKRDTEGSITFSQISITGVPSA
jgi:mannose-6-phosphate isomerase-like protein (cupin superfamily)